MTYRPPAALRTGHSDSPGLTCLYTETGGDDWKQDRRVGTVEDRELAEAIVEAVNAHYGLTSRAERTATDAAVAQLAREMGVPPPGETSGGEMTDQQIIDATKAEFAPLPEVKTTAPQVPAGCICAYTWHVDGHWGAVARNGPLASCPADHTEIDAAAARA